MRMMEKRYSHTGQVTGYSFLKLPSKIPGTVESYVTETIKQVWEKNEAFKDVSHLCDIVHAILNSWPNEARRLDRKTLESNVTEVFEDPQNKKALDKKMVRYEELKKECLRNYKSFVSSIEPRGDKILPYCRLTHIIYYMSEPRIIEGTLGHGSYYPICFRLAKDLLEYDKIAFDVLKKCFPLEEDYIERNWGNDIPVDKAQYVIKQISPEVSDVEYLPSVTVSVFVEKTKKLILNLIQDKKLAAYPTLVEGEFAVKREELEEAFKKRYVDGEAKAKKDKNKPHDSRELKSCQKLLGALIIEFCIESRKVNPDSKHPHLTSQIGGILSRLDLKMGEKTI